MFIYAILQYVEIPEFELVHVYTLQVAIYINLYRQ